MSKKAKTDPTELDPKVEAAVDELKKMQDKIEKVEEQFDQKVLELQAEFDKKKRPIFVERNTVIAKIPNFWYTAIVHHKAIEPLLLLEDEDIFAYCTSVFVDEKENVKKGFKIKMTFSSNAFFDDTELWKDVEYGEDGEAKLTHSGVTWKPGTLYRPMPRAGRSGSQPGFWEGGDWTLGVYSGPLAKASSIFLQEHV